MDAAAPPARPVRIVRPTWVWAGGVLIVGTLLGLMPRSVGGTWWLPWLGMILVAGAWILFAVGRDRAVPGASGVVALFVLALWPVASQIVWQLLTPGFDPNAATPTWWMIASTVDALVPAVAAVIAALAVWRGGVVPREFRVVPLIAAGLCIVPAIAFQIGATAMAMSGGVSAGMFVGLSQFASLCAVVGLVGLGVVAIVSGLQPRQAAASGTVVYPPAD